MKDILKKAVATPLLLLGLFNANAQRPVLSDQLAEKAIYSLELDAGKSGWNNISSQKAITDGLILCGLNNVWKNSANGEYFKQIQKKIDNVLDNSGNITGFNPENINEEVFKNGSSLLLLYQVTGKQKYYTAATILWNGLAKRLAADSNRGSEVNSYLTEPFKAAYAAAFHQPETFESIANTFINSEKQIRAQETRIWFAMALVDVLDNFPADHPKRSALINILERSVNTDQKNPSISNMISAISVYNLAKAIRMGYLSKKYIPLVGKRFDEIKKEFSAKKNIDRNNTLDKTGAFLLASNEIELINAPKRGAGLTVTLDSYFNNETQKDIAGQKVSWHYKWEELANGGFSMWGGLFKTAGFDISTLKAAPTAENLKNTAVYIIVDPDTEKETDHPAYVEKGHIDVITDWVKAGGVLVLMANDSANCELEHFNKLAANFGVQFNKDCKNKVEGNKFEMGKVLAPVNHPIFRTSRQFFIKELSSISVSGAAKPSITDSEGNVIIATSKLGKGTVFAIGDPWLYNEYVDGRRLPSTYENFQAARDLVYWLAEQAKK